MINTSKLKSVARKVTSTTACVVLLSSQGYAQFTIPPSPIPPLPAGATVYVGPSSITVVSVEGGATLAELAASGHAGITRTTSYPIPAQAPPPPACPASPAPGTTLPASCCSGLLRAIGIGAAMGAAAVTCLAVLDSDGSRRSRAQSLEAEQMPDVPIGLRPSGKH